MTAIRNVIVGTAGHIDHGKSSVVRSLTGTDPDRLAEEQARGMTIDLGFATYTHSSGAQVGIIDVPGHERFIKNMVAGATSVDVVVLVVAADDGVMPQTREHLEILGLLGVRRGLVVLSKIDLVDEDMVELAKQDVLDFVQGTFLEGAPLLRVSAVTGDGLDTLRARLDELVAQTEPRSDEGPFRMPVQRVFSAHGHGLVVTGVPISGRVQPEDRVEVLGVGRARVRGIQAYGASRESGRAGHSTALNLSGIEREDVTRGAVVATPGVFDQARFITLDYSHVHDELALRNQHPVRLHIGTSELIGRVALLSGESLARGGRGPVQVRLDEAVGCAPGDRALLRDAAGMQLLGGGPVLSLEHGRRKRGKERVLEELEARRAALGDHAALAVTAVRAAGVRGLDPAALAVQTGRPAEELDALLAPALENGELVRAGGRWLDGDAVNELADGVVKALKKGHKQRPLLEWLDVASLRAALDCDPSLLSAVFEHDDRVEVAPGGRVRRRGHRVSLGPELAAARERVLAALEQGGATPPAVDEGLTGLDAKAHASLVEMMRASGEIVLVGEHAFSPRALEVLVATLRRHAGERDGEIDIPTLRDALGTTRKYLIPLLEHFDAQGLTVRHGDRRVLRRREAGT